MKKPVMKGKPMFGKKVVDKDGDAMKGGGSCKMASGGTVRGGGAALRGLKFKEC